MALTAAGCGTNLDVPKAPPPGVQVTAPRASLAAPQLPAYAPEMHLHPRWLGTRVWTERETAVDALRRIGPSALPALVELLHGSDRDLRELAARALALMGPEAKTAVPDLEAALSDLDPDVRKNVVRALGQMGPGAESAIPVLVEEIHRPGPILDAPKATGSSENAPPEKRDILP